MSTTIIYLGTDYVGTTTNVTFKLPNGDSVPGDNTVVVTWELLDRCGDPIASGIGTFVEAGSYTFTIDYLDFSSQIPVNPTSYKLGQLNVRHSVGGADVSVGSNIKFMYPTLVTA